MASSPRPIDSRYGFKASAGVYGMPVSSRSVRASPASTYWAMKRTPRLDSMRWMPAATSTFTSASGRGGRRG